MFSLKLWQIAYMDVYINLKVSCEKFASRKVWRRYEKIWNYLMKTQFLEYLLTCPSLYRHLSQSTSKLVDIGLISEGEERIYERWGHMLDIN